jgi:hypothetical protein
VRSPPADVGGLTIPPAPASGLVLPVLGNGTTPHRPAGFTPFTAGWPWTRVLARFGGFMHQVPSPGGRNEVGADGRRAHIYFAVGGRLFDQRRTPCRAPTTEEGEAFSRAFLGGPGRMTGNEVARLVAADERRRPFPVTDGGGPSVCPEVFTTASVGISSPGPTSPYRTFRNLTNTSPSWP